MAILRLLKRGYNTLAMNTVIFDEENTFPGRPPSEPRLTDLPKLLNFFFPRIITSQRDANLALLIIFIVCLILIVFLWRTSGSTITTGGPGPSQAELDAYRKIQPY